jgi:hypothetical protein
MYFPPLGLLNRDVTADTAAIASASRTAADFGFPAMRSVAMLTWLKRASQPDVITSPQFNIDVTRKIASISTLVIT